MITVKLIAHTPEPEKVVAAAAKLCYSNAHIDTLLDGLTPEKSREFVEMLASMGHESPTEHVSFTFGIEGVSRSLLAQITRHRIASYSVQSQRYVNKVAFEYVTPESIRDNPNALEQYEWGMKAIQKVYNTMLSWGVDKEDARYILPNACTTNLVLTANARELRHIFALRTCTRAQEEIRELAEKMLKICKEVSPTIFEDAGPSCVRDGFCREQKSCHRAPKLERVLEIMDEIDGLADIRDMQRTAERECHR